MKRAEVDAVSRAKQGDERVRDRGMTGYQPGTDERQIDEKERPSEAVNCCHKYHTR